MARRKVILQGPIELEGAATQLEREAASVGNSSTATVIVDVYKAPTGGGGTAIELQTSSGTPTNPFQRPTNDLWVTPTNFVLGIAPGSSGAYLLDMPASLGDAIRWSVTTFGGGVGTLQFAVTVFFTEE